jgi:hypothetical protein
MWVVKVTPRPLYPQEGEIMKTQIDAYYMRINILIWIGKIQNSHIYTEERSVYLVMGRVSTYK